MLFFKRRDVALRDSLRVLLPESLKMYTYFVDNIGERVKEIKSEIAKYNASQNAGDKLITLRYLSSMPVTIANYKEQVDKFKAAADKERNLTAEMLKVKKQYEKKDAENNKAMADVLEGVYTIHLKQYRDHVVETEKYMKDVTTALDRYDAGGARDSNMYYTLTVDAPVNIKYLMNLVEVVKKELDRYDDKDFKNAKALVKMRGELFARNLKNVMHMNTTMDRIQAAIRARKTRSASKKRASGQETERNVNGRRL